MMKSFSLLCLLFVPFGLLQAQDIFLKLHANISASDPEYVFDNRNLFVESNYGNTIGFAISVSGRIKGNLYLRAMLRHSKYSYSVSGLRWSNQSTNYQLDYADFLLDKTYFGVLPEWRLKVTKKSYVVFNAGLGIGYANGGFEGGLYLIENSISEGWSDAPRPQFESITGLYMAGMEYAVMYGKVGFSLALDYLGTDNIRTNRRALGVKFSQLSMDFGILYAL